MDFFSRFFLVALIPFLLGCSPLRKAEEAIKDDILVSVPYGSDISETLNFLRVKKYKIDAINEKTGFYDQRTKPAKITGSMFIRAEFGEYKNILSIATSVTVYFGFDENGKLTDIWVWKTTDAP
jgi:hypothetical protein